MRKSQPPRDAHGSLVQLRRSSRLPRQSSTGSDYPSRLSFLGAISPTGAPFSFDAAQWLKPGVDNQVAIRFTHATGAGGICFPAMLIATAGEHITAELDAFRQ